MQRAGGVGMFFRHRFPALDLLHRIQHGNNAVLAEGEFLAALHAMEDEDAHIRQ